MNRLPQRKTISSFPRLSTILFLSLILMGGVLLSFNRPVAANMPLEIPLGFDAGIPPEDFTIANEMVMGNAFSLDTFVMDGEAIAHVEATNEQSGSADSVVGVELGFVWPDPPYTGTMAENATVRVEIDLEYQIEAAPDPFEGTAVAEVRAEPVGLTEFVRSETNGMDESPVTIVFTTTVGEMPPALDFVAFAHATAGDVGPTELYSGANARIAVSMIRILFPPDIMAFGMEITQGLQSMDNTVDLIAGKPTFVRVYAQVFNPEDAGIKTAVQLRVTKGGAEALLDPQADIEIPANPRRTQLKHSYLFKVPNAFTTGTVTFKAEINHTNNGRERSPEEMVYDNNMLEHAVTYRTVSNLNMTIIDMRYRKCSGCPLQSISNFDVTRVHDWMTAAFPVPDVKYRSRTFEMRTTSPGSYDVLRQVQKIRRSEINDGVDGARCSLYLGLVDDSNGSYFLRGLGNVGEYTAFAPAGSKGFAWDTDGSYADWYGAHEAAHGLGREHAACNGEPDPDPGFPTISPLRASISQVPNRHQWDQVYGFDWTHPSGKPQVYDESYRDVMSYCDNQWVSEYTYEGLIAQIDTLAGLCTEPVSRVDDYLMVSGLITVTDGITTARLDPLYVLPQVIAPVPDLVTSAEIILLDPLDTELARYPFQPVEMHLDEAHAIPEQELFMIDEVVPFVMGTVKVEIEMNGNVIAVIEAGATEPTVTVNEPGSRSTMQTLTWTANDVDGDDLTFIVQYTPDNGVTWRTLAIDLTETTYTIDTSELPAGAMAMYRVLASDGIHTAVGDTLPFVLANHAPSAEILTPADGETVATGQAVGFNGFSYDADTGSTADSAFAWSSDLDGALGTGANLAVAGLSVGTHTITLTVDDGAGGVTADSITLIVVATVGELPPVADELSVAPGAVSLDYSMFPTQTVVVDSTGGGMLNWSAAASEAWIQLDMVSGTTGDEVVISADDTMLGAGLFTGIVTVTNSADVNDVQFISVSYDRTQVPTAVQLQADTMTQAPLALLGWLVLMMGTMQIIRWRRRQNN